MTRLFGTDGIRGVASQDLTPELATSVGRAAAVVAAGTGRPGRVVVGRDTRPSGPMLEDAVISGLLSTGAEVLKLDVIPTPTVAYLTRQFGADLGVVISASHNPAEYNGLKLFDKSGFKFSLSDEEAVEKLVLESAVALNQPTGKHPSGVLDMAAEGRRRYIDHVTKCLPACPEGFRVTLDCAYGAAHSLAGEVFQAAGATVAVINGRPEGDKINVECGSTNPICVRDEVLARADGRIGLAFDGDGDRMIAVDEDGNICDGDYIMAIAGIYLKENGCLSKNTLVTTVMANCGFDLAMSEHGIGIRKTDVGDRFVLAELLENELNFGGEQSGHIIFLDHNTTGDGIITGLMLLSVMAESGRTLKDLKTVLRKLPQVLINVRVVEKTGLDGADVVWEEVRLCEQKLAGRGRVLVRPSGTEPFIRVMVEAETEEAAGDVAGRLAAIVEREMGV